MPANDKIKPYVWLDELVDVDELDEDDVVPGIRNDINIIKSKIGNIIDLILKIDFSSNIDRSCTIEPFI